MAFESRSNIVDVYVRYLREKVDRPFGRELDRDRARRRLPAAKDGGDEPAADPGRLTLAFAVGMAVVLAAMGVFVYVRVGRRAPRVRRPDLAAQAREALTTHGATAGRSSTPTPSDGPTIAQVARSTGHGDSSPAALAPPWLLPIRAASPRRAVEPQRSGACAASWRLARDPAPARRAAAVLVVASSLAARDGVPAPPRARVSLRGTGSRCCSPPRRLRPRGRSAAAGRGDAPTCGRGHQRATPGRRLPVPRSVTRSRRSR